MPVNRRRRKRGASGGNGHHDEPAEERTLYDCAHARVWDSRIYCAKGYKLSQLSYDGGLDADRLAKGRPLVLGVCRYCADFECMGAPVPDDERGWQPWLGGEEIK